MKIDVSGCAQPAHVRTAPSHHVLGVVGQASHCTDAVCVRAAVLVADHLLCACALSDLTFSWRPSLLCCSACLPHSRCAAPGTCQASVCPTWGRRSSPAGLAPGLASGLLPFAAPPCGALFARLLSVLRLDLPLCFRGAFSLGASGKRVERKVNNVACLKLQQRVLGWV